MSEQDRLRQAEALARTGATPETIRAWAQDNGWPVGHRGRLSKEVMEAYVEAHPRRVELPPALPRKRTLPPKRQAIRMDPAPAYVGKGWTISKHAAERATELGFEPDELLEAAVYPDMTYRQGDRLGSDALHRKGDVTVVVALSSRVVKTVVLTQPERWEHGADRRTG